MRVLLLAGTAEARALAGLATEHEITASLAGVTEAPADLGVPTRRGGFGGIAGLIAWLEAHRIEALIDATHPFAAQMPWHAAEAADRVGLPRLRLLRLGWEISPDWQVIETLEAAATLLPSGARVLLTTGRGEIAPFTARPDCSFWLRSIDDPGPLPGHITSIRGRPPFTEESERTLMERHGITHLVSKNAGGSAAKLEAAAGSGITILMVSRPPQPPGPTVATPEAALDWLDRLAQGENR
ncbi:MAG: cobalt-precorrin-6A reductase [Pseudomonadota bacterium]